MNGAGIAARINLFRDAVLLSGFMLLLFSMVGISCFAGALHYTCVGAVGYDVFDAEANATQRQVYLDGAWQNNENAWTATTPRYDCPKTLKCALSETKMLLTNVTCVPRSAITEDPLGEYMPHVTLLECIPCARTGMRKPRTGMYMLTVEKA